MQALGFQFETSAPLVETPFSNKLSRYGTPLAFTGDSEAIAGFLSKGFEGDMHILTLTLQKVSSPPNQETYQINATLTQIGATSSVQSVPSNEPSR